MSDPSIGEFILVVPSYIGGGLIGGYLAWVHAPPVGGEYWPYIRALAAIVGAAVGAHVATLALLVLVAVVVGILGVVLK